MLALIPSPFSLQESDQPPFILTTATRVHHPRVLSASVEVFVQEVAGLTSLRLASGDRSTSDGRDPCPGGIHLEIDPALRTAVPGLPSTIGLDPSGEGAGEAHTITITAAGIRIVGESAAGCFRGMTTLVQIIASSLGDATAPSGVALPALQIADAPRFAWRGLSLDVVRSFRPPQEVRDIIDILAFYRCNTLHLHLTDDQGWRIEIPTRPDLTIEGSKGALGDRPGGHYRLSDLEALVTYAADRFITIIPEIDMPGHVSAVMRSYPELLGEGMEVSEYLSQAYLDPRDAGVRAFVADVVEQLCRLTPGPYVHIGGDEAFGMPEDRYREFIEMATALVTAHGKQPVAWQEAIRGGFDDGALIQYWIRLDIDAAEEHSAPTASDAVGSVDSLQLSPEVQAILAEMLARSVTDLEEASARDVPVLLSPASHVYLDRPYAEPSADPAQEQARESLGLQVYPPKTVAESYDWTPEQLLDDVTLVGIEAAIWSETLATAAEVQFMLLPRFAGVAEHAWAQEAAGWPVHARKLAHQAPVLDARGWSYFRSSLIDWDLVDTQEVPGPVRGSRR